MKDSQEDNQPGQSLEARINEIEKDFHSQIETLESQISQIKELYTTRIDALKVCLGEPCTPLKTPKPARRKVIQKRDDTESAAKPGAKPKATTMVFRAYSEAFKGRYGVEPVRNSATNAKIVQFVRRIGEEDALEVAKFYVRYNDAFYIKCMHPIGLMLKDAETLHARWRSGHFVSSSQAKNVERTQANINASQSYLNKKYGTNDDEQKRNTAKLPLNG